MLACQAVKMLLSTSLVGVHTSVCTRGVSSPDFYQSQVLHTKVYRGIRGVTSSSGRGVTSGKALG